MTNIEQLLKNFFCSDLQERITQLREENQRLNETNTDLQSEVADLAAENEDYRQVLNSIQKGKVL